MVARDLTQLILSIIIEMKNGNYESVDPNIHALKYNYFTPNFSNKVSKSDLVNTLNLPKTFKPSKFAELSELVSSNIEECLQNIQFNQTSYVSTVNIYSLSQQANLRKKQTKLNSTTNCLQHIRNDLDREVFENQALDLVHKSSDQLLELKNIICNKDSLTNYSIKQHRNLVIVFLYNKIKEITCKMEELRRKRFEYLKEKESRLNSNYSEIKRRRKSAVTDKQNIKEKNCYNVADIDADEKRLFEQENRLISSHYYHQIQKEAKNKFDVDSATIAQLEHTQSKAIEVSKLFQLFSQELSQQREQIETLQSTAELSNENFGEGLTHLRKAVHRSSSQNSFMIFIIFAVSGLSLLFLD